MRTSILRPFAAAHFESATKEARAVESMKSTADKSKIRFDSAAAESNLIFDLSAVDFIDSTALASLVALSKWAAANGRKMEVRNPSNPVRIILELTALDRVLNVTDQPVRQ